MMMMMMRVMTKWRRLRRIKINNILNKTKHFVFLLLVVAF